MGNFSDSGGCDRTLSGGVGVCFHQSCDSVFHRCLPDDLAKPADMIAATSNRPVSPVENVSSDRQPVRRDLAASMGDGASYGVMVGIGETYVPAFVLAAGLGDVFAGLIASVPVFLGSVLQLISPAAIRILKSNKLWVMLNASIQAACFIPLIVAATYGAISQWQALFITSVYWATSLATGPAWNTWMGAVVPKSVRPHFFAKRARFSQAMTLAGFLAGGFILQAGTSSAAPTRAYILLFLIAGISRVISAFCLSRKSEPQPARLVDDLPFMQRAMSFGRGRAGRLLLFVVCMQVGVCISGPFFVPYMLKGLKLTYIEYVILIGTSFVAKFLTLPYWGRLAKKVGAQQLLWIGAICITPLAAAWDVSFNYGWLVLVQILAGTAWAAYELAVTLLFLEAIPEHERTGTLTIYNVANNAALLAGSLIGTFMLRSMDVTIEAYLWVFAVSTAARGASLLILATVPKMSSGVVEPTFRPLSVQPSMGSIDQPVLAGLPADAENQVAENELLLSVENDTNSGIPLQNRSSVFPEEAPAKSPSEGSDHT